MRDVTLGHSSDVYSFAHKNKGGACANDLLHNWGYLYSATFLAPFFMGPDERKRWVNGPRKNSFDNIIRTDFAVVVLTRL